MNKLTIFALLLALNTSACTLLYVPDVQQGNVITDEMIAKLKPGMTTRQVIFVLGSPLIQDPFHKDRWDYFYSYKDNEKNTFKKSLVSVLFEDGVMVEVKVEPKRASLIKPENEITIKPEIHEKIGPDPD